MGVISVRRAGRWGRAGECVPSPASGRGLGRGRLFVLPTQCGEQNVNAGGARQRPTFFARAKKVGKENTPRFRRNPESANLERAAKELASLKQLSPAFGFPAQGRRTRLRQREENRRISLRLFALRALT
jgi:hypothetical protein